MVDKENFEKDINVPCKEPIMVDGVNVDECLFYQSNFEEDYDVKIKHFCSNWHNSCESANNSNCYFKQLKRKTAECEKYKKAFDEIAEHYEKVIKNLTTYDDRHDANISIKALHNISDIINKAKGGNDE